MLDSRPRRQSVLATGLFLVLSLLWLGHILFENGGLWSLAVLIACIGGFAVESYRLWRDHL